MKPKEKANRLFTLMWGSLQNGMPREEAKRCSLLAVQEIINSNPHSNPLNTKVHSTMEYWQEVKEELHKL